MILEGKKKKAIKLLNADIKYMKTNCSDSAIQAQYLVDYAHMFSSIEEKLIGKSLYEEAKSLLES